MTSFRGTQIFLAAVACLTLSVGAYAVWAEYSSFPPRFRGFAEVTRRGEVAGVCVATLSRWGAAAPASATP